MEKFFTISLIGSVMILVIVLLRALLHNRVHRTVFLLLWLLAAIRLSLPVVTSSSVSVYNLLPKGETGITETYEQILTEPIGSMTVLQEEGFVSHEPVATDPDVSYIETIEPTEIITGYSAERFSFNFGQILTVLWALGCGGCFLFFLFVHIRARLRYRFAIAEEGPDFLGNIRLKRSDEISSPLVYGFFRPVILLPHDFPKKDSPEYEQVLLHEVTHVRSGDLWFKLFMLFVTCIHWYNPLVWLMLRLSTQDLEIRCDARVIRKLGQKKAYAMTLVRAEVRQSTHFAEAAFAFSLTELRLNAIAKAKVYLPRSIAVFALLSVILICCFSTGPKAEATEESLEERLSTDLVATQTEPVEESKPAPALNLDASEELPYLLSCGFEEYGSVMELELKETQILSLPLRLPEDTTFRVEADSGEFLSVAGEYSYDEQLYYLTFHAQGSGETEISLSVAGIPWFKIRVRVEFDPYFIVPEWEKIETYGASQSMSMRSGLYNATSFSLKLPKEATFVYDLTTTNGESAPYNSISVNSYYHPDTGKLQVQVGSEYFTGKAVFYFYIRGIYWCKMHVTIYSGRQYSYSNSYSISYSNSYSSNSGNSTYDILSSIGPQPCVPGYSGNASANGPIIVISPISTGNGNYIAPGTYWP